MSVNVSKSEHSGKPVLNQDEFEKELLAVLKSTEGHSISLDGRLLFRSDKYQCNLTATHVCYEPSSGDVVLVGAYRSGFKILNSDLSINKDNIRIPLKEVFSDLNVVGIDPMRLVGKIQKGVIRKYLLEPIKSLCCFGMMPNGYLDVKDINSGSIVKTSKDGVSKLFLSEDEYGLKVNYLNDMNKLRSAISLSLGEIQHIGVLANKIVSENRKVMHELSSTIQELNPVSMTQTEGDILRLETDVLKTYISRHEDFSLDMLRASVRILFTNDLVHNLSRSEVVNKFGSGRKKFEQHI